MSKNGGASNADRQRAHQLKRKPEKRRTEAERDWLREYDRKHTGPANGSMPRERKGRHRVAIEIEGGGGDDAKRTPELVRAEGERIDRVINACSAMVEAATSAFKNEISSRDGIIKMLLESRSKTERTYADVLVALKNAVVSSATAEAQLAAIQAAQQLEEEQQGQRLDADFMKLVKRELGVGGDDAKSNGHATNGKTEPGGEG